RHLGSALTDVTYVFDEPTIGLHPHDIATMNSLLEDLRDKGNTVLVVEHKPETIAIADHVVDLGPRAGADGGTVQYPGDLAGLRAPCTLTGTHLDHRLAHGHPPHTHRDARDPRRRPAQPPVGGRGHPARRADRGHRGGRVRQELARARLDAQGRRGGGGRPDRDPRLPALEPRDLHRP